MSFKYDPFGGRIYKSSSAGTSIFAYDGDNLVEETNSSGTAVARWTQTNNIDEPLAMLRSGATTFYNADGFGSITSLSNSSGANAQTYTYDSSGNIAGNRLTRAPQPTGATSTYGYDNIYELQSVTQSGSTTESYAYDPVGNRLTDLGSAAWSFELAASSEATVPNPITQDPGRRTEPGAPGS